MENYLMCNIPKEIIIFLSQHCHVTDHVTRTRTNYLLELKGNRAFIFFIFFSLRTSFNYRYFV